MDEKDFPSNTNFQAGPKREETGKKVTKVVVGEVRHRKPTFGKRLKETLFVTDGTSVGQYIFFDVLIPAFKDMIYDAGNETLRRILLGEGRTPTSQRRSTTQPSGGYVAYHRSSSNPPWKKEPQQQERRRRTGFTFDDIILTTRAEGEEVIDRLFDILSRYEVVTVADLYDLLGESCPYTNQNWGWTELRGASVVMLSRDSYLLDLPKPEPLDQR